MPNKHVRAAAEGLPNPMTARDVLNDLEGGLHDAVNMAEIATILVDGTHRRPPVQGHFHVDEATMRLLAFASFHALSLIEKVKAEWDDLHERAVAEKGGAK